jgi:hypothetical protein
MRYVRVALVSAAATGLLSFASPAIAELGAPSGCARCSPANVAEPTEQTVPANGLEKGIGAALGATALVPETVLTIPRHPSGCHVEVWGATNPPAHHTVCP